MHAGYAGVKVAMKKQMDLIYPVVGILTSVGAMYAYYYYLFSEELVPGSIPDWMTSGDLFIAVGAFLMPTILYCLLCLVMIVTNTENDRRPWAEFGLSILVPFFFYLLIAVLVPMVRGYSDGLLFLWLSIIGVFMLLFIFFRLFYVLHTQKKFSREYELFWKIPFVFILPLLGLKLNYELHVFGDLSSIWFYVVLIFNAILLCLPAPARPARRLLLYTGRTVTFSFTLYFFVLFLPFLPFAMLLTLVFGIGFLFLTPFILFIIHIGDLLSDYEYLSRFFKPVRLMLLAVAGVCFIPLCITGTFMLDRKILHNTLAYVYSPDYSKEYSIRKQSVLRVLAHVGKHQEENFFYNGTPYISSWYKKIVLDNMMLSQYKQTVLNQLVSGQDAEYPDGPFTTETAIDEQVKLRKVEIESSYDLNQQAWISRIDLSIQNSVNGAWNGEYLTRFELPDGCWISDYYLDVNGVREPGILAEKKAATWIYNQITRRNQDPGLVRYVSDREVELKVFPLARGEVRYTGLEFIHADPVILKIDDQEIRLGDPEQVAGEYTGRPNRNAEAARYLSPQDKALLPQANPQPYFHFIVDISNNGIQRGDPEESARQLRNRYEQSIRNLLALHGLAAQHYKVTYTNDACYTREYKVNEEVSLDWTKELPARMKPFQRGFFLQRAMEIILVENFREQRNHYPILVVLTDHIEKSIMPSNLNELRFTYPFMDIFFIYQEMRCKTIPYLQVTAGVFILSKNIGRDCLSRMTANLRSSIFLTKTLYRPGTQKR